MRLGWGGRIATGAAALLAAGPLSAQSINDFRLPGATATTAPTGTQGPVDPDNPVVQARIVRPSPSPTPEPAPSPASTATPAARPPAVAPAARREAGASVKPAAKSAAQPAVSVPIPAATTLPASPAASAPPTAPQPLPSALPSAIPQAGSAPAENAAIPGGVWPWIAAILALAALLFAALWWRSRKARTVVIEFEAPVPAPRPTQREEQPDAAAPPPPAAQTPEPPLAAAPALPGLAITLEARRMTASLMATTLSYGITLTNTGKEPLSTLAIEGDMISAHASLPPDLQIASGARRLDLRHALVSLKPGESARFNGDFRLPLTAITPIRSGEAAFFVPLARLRVEASTAAGQPVVMAETFVIGELGETADAALRPFRLDLGPRTYSRLGQRPVS